MIWQGVAGPLLLEAPVDGRLRQGPACDKREGGRSGARHREKQLAVEFVVEQR